jgi:transcriptional regulator with XRE-family HTH domain
MPTDTNTHRTIHEGRNVKRFREMLGIKQEALALQLESTSPGHGEGSWNQRKISLLEQKETIDAPLLQQISEVLKIPVEAIQNFDEEQAVNIIANTFNIEKDAYIGNSQPTFNINPIEEIRKLHEEKMALYERMLKEKDEMMGRLEKLIEKE